MLSFVTQLSTSLDEIFLWGFGKRELKNQERAIKNYDSKNLN
jgi:hypothetical protein